MPIIQVNFHLFADDINRAISFYTRNFNFELMGQIRGEHQAGGQH